MKQKSLFLMCGTPGSGKSTWVKKQIAECKYPTEWVSRDNIRFGMLQNGEEYFAHETDVFETFCKEIQKALDEDKVVFADATHLNEKSRNKTLDKLNLDGVTIYAVDFNMPLEVCLAQNENRIGTRAYVPRSVIRRMSSQYVAPGDNEKYKYHVLHAIHMEE